MNKVSNGRQYTVRNFSHSVKWPNTARVVKQVCSNGSEAGNEKCVQNSGKNYALGAYFHAVTW